MNAVPFDHSRFYSSFSISYRTDYFNYWVRKNVRKRIRAWKEICCFVLSGRIKRLTWKSDLPKYAQINKVALSRNMMRYGHMTSGTISLTIPKLKNIEEGLVSPHWLVTTGITPSFPFSKTNLANNQPITLTLTK